MLLLFILYIFFNLICFSLGLYLWEHILGGKLETKMDGIWSYGFKKIDNLKLK